MRTFSRLGTLKQLLIDIRSSLWFVPTLIVVATAALAIGLIELDQQFDPILRERWPRLFAAEAEGARAMLSAIAGSMSTVAGVVFSITIVALSLASSQYTSRVLRNFMRDPANQVVLGVFLGIYTYCLLVLRTISSGSNGAFIPSLAVVGGVVLALLGIGVFVFFIHHIAASIQASEIIDAITRETLRVIDRLFPHDLGDDADDVAEDPGQLAPGTPWHPVPALTTGYIQTVDPEALLRFAGERRTVVRMEAGIGDFVAQDRPIASLALTAPPDAATVRALNRIYAIDSYRTTDQDAAFGIRQLVDIALKALSPGINDTTTAVMCIEYLSVILARCAARRMASPHRFDGNDLRVIARGPTFDRLVALAFDQILENAEGNTEIITRMLRAIEQIADVARNTRRRHILLRHVEVIADVADRSVKSAYARDIIEADIARVSAMLSKNERHPLYISEQTKLYDGGAQARH